MAGAAHADYTARLFFENQSTGLSGPGAVHARPGDEIGVRFRFVGGIWPNTWGTLQITLCQNSVLTAEDGATWESQLTQTVVPTENFPIRVFAGDKDLYDHAVDPSGFSGGDFVCHGNYAMVGVRGGAPEALNWDVTLFRFAARGNVGDELNWALDGRTTSTGLSTRLLDSAGTSVDITDNFVRIVPEPGGGAILALGATGLLALRRRAR